MKSSKLSLLVVVGLWFAAWVSAADPASKPCVFCEIANGRRPAQIVYRDEAVVAFMDHAPRNPGYVLVVPIAHADNVLDTPPETWARVATVAQRIAVAIRDTDIPAEGIKFISNAGLAAEQSVFHLHLHVVPRFAGEITLEGPLPRAASEELEATAAKIRTALANRSSTIEPDDLP